MTAAEPSPIQALPYAAIQPDWLAVEADINSGSILAEDVWLSVYKQGSPSVHGKVRCSRPDEQAAAIQYEGRNGVAVTVQGVRMPT